MVIGRLLLTDADLQYVCEIPPHVSEKLATHVHLALEEAEQRVLYVLHRTLHGSDGLWRGGVRYMLRF